MKGVIIGGGYATGRELSEYFLSQGPHGALLAMALATLLWALICATAFAFAQRLRVFEYRSFSERLLGRGAILFEVCLLLFCVLLLAVFGAAAGEVVASLFAVPEFVGTITLALLIGGVASFGGDAVERLFKYVSPFLYLVYAAFLILAFAKFGDRIDATLERGGIGSGWPISGLTYGTYNMIAVVMILPTLRYLRSTREAVTAGIIAAPLAMLPAFAFVTAMLAFHPEVLSATLPSDYILTRLDSTAFRFVFQLMVFGALLEGGVGVVHTINERAVAWQGKRQTHGDVSCWFRPLLTLAVLAVCMFAADLIGLADLIAGGYRILAAVFLLTFVLPLMTIGVVKLVRSHAGAARIHGHGEA
nr:hypothetical protein [Pacificimonas pallii]